MKELELERSLMEKSIKLRELDISSCDYKKQKEIRKQQTDYYNKWKLISGILKERENEKTNKTIM